MRYDVGRFRRPMRRSTEGQLMSLISLGDGSTLSLDFTTGQLDPRLTFTRASTVATFINASGIVATATTNEPRFDYDPTTLAPLGLLVEGTATNVLTGFTAGGWGRQNVDGSGTAGALANGQTGPDGVANTAARITTAAATTFPANMFVAFATNAAGASRTFSVWLRGVGSNTTASIAIVGSNTPAGVASSQSGHSVTLATSTSGNNLLALVTGLSTTAWTRVSISRTDAQASADSYRICPGNHTGTISSGLAVDVYGVQAESGIGMSSTIPTGASTVQRLADNCSIVSPNFSTWYNQGEGTFLLHCQLNRIGAQHLLNVNVNNAAPRLMITESSSQFNASTENPSGTNFNLALGSSSTNAAKVIAAFKNLDVAGTRNGATVQTSTAMTVPTTVNLLRIGSAEGGYQYMTGTVSLLKYWPTRLPNAQLQSLTT